MLSHPDPNLSFSGHGYLAGVVPERNGGSSPAARIPGHRKEPRPGDEEINPGPAPRSPVGVPGSVKPPPATLVLRRNAWSPCRSSMHGKSTIG